MLYPIILTGILFAPPAYAQTGDGELPAEYASCTKPSLSRQDIADIVTRARDNDQTLPRQSGSRTWTLRIRCHYIYTERWIVGTDYVPQQIRIDEFGRIVDWVQGFSEEGSSAEESLYPCYDKALSIAEASQFVAASRNKFSDLPRYKVPLETQLDRKRCGYIYVEKVSLGRVDGKDKFAYYDFYLDQYGALQYFRLEKYAGPLAANAAEGDFPAEYASCTKPSLSRQAIVEIVARARRNNEIAAPPIEDESRVTVIRHRCHYSYGEYGTTVSYPAQSILIDEFGRIIKSTYGHSVGGNEHHCPDTALSVAETSKFVEASREKFSDLPPYRAGTEVSFSSHRSDCFYVHAEELYLGRVDGKKVFKNYLFYLDHFGALFDFFIQDQRY